MHQVYRQTVVKNVREDKFLASEFLFPVKPHQHGVCHDAGNKTGNKGRSALILEVPPSGEWTYPLGQSRCPAQGFHDLPHKEADAKVSQQTEKREKEITVDLLWREPRTPDMHCVQSHSQGCGRH